MRWLPLRSEGWPSPSLVLLLRAALCSGGGEARQAWSNWLATHTIDGAEDAAFFLLPAIYANLQASGEDVPGKEQLKGIHRQAWARNQLAIRSFAKAMRVFEEAGVEAIALKGLPLVLLHYRRVGERLMYDVDVLVPEAQWADAAEALTEAGWALAKPIPDPDFSPFIHAVACKHPGLAEIDLHARPFPFQRNKRAETAFRERAIRVEAHGLSFLAPNPEDLLLLVLAHGRRADTHSVARWVVDAATLLRSSAINWEAFFHSATDLGVFLPVRDALTWLANFLEGSVPDDVLDRAWSIDAPPEAEAAYASLVRGLSRRNLWASHRWRYKTGAIAWGRRPSLTGYANYVLRFYQYAWGLPRRARVPPALLGHAPRYLLKKWKERQAATHLPPRAQPKGA